MTMNDETNPGAAAVATDPAAAAAAADPAAVVDPNAAAAPNAGADTDPKPGDEQGSEAAKTPEQLEAEKLAADKKAEEDAANAVPEVYVIPELPEGYTLEGPRLEYVQKIAKEVGLSQAQFNDSAVKYVELQKQAKEFEVAEWGKQSEAEFGVGLPAMHTDVQVALKALGTERPNLVEDFDAEGWGNHPSALWLFAKVGKLLREGGMEGLNNPAPNPGGADFGAKLFDHPTSQPNKG